VICGGPVPPAPGARGPALAEVPGTLDVVPGHGDTFHPVPGSALFRGETSPAQGFRVGRSVGLQFHAELGPEGFRAWVEGSAGPLRRSGRNPETLLADGLPRLTAALPALDRLLPAPAPRARAAPPPGVG